MKLTSKIGELIKESGLRDDYIRDKLGIKQKQLLNIKKGESYPTVPKLFLLAKLLDCKIEELYDVEENE